MPHQLLRNDLTAGPEPYAVEASGVWITDEHGKRYLDGSSGPVVSAIGHGHPAVVKAIAEQATRLTYAHRSAFLTRPIVQLAERLCAFTGFDAAWFVGSGSEATEAAIGLALRYHRERAAPERSWFLSMRRGYHGNTLGALSLSGNARRDVAGDLVHDFPALPEPYAFREQQGRTEQDWVADMLDTARGLFGEHASRLAGIVLEPVGGATMGATVPSPAYLQGLRALCDEYGVLLIADEVMSGMGRCGTPLAMQHFGVQADITALGKGLGSGYTPIAATLISARVHDTLREGSGRILGGHTYGGNPLSAATALAVLDVIESDGVLQNATVMGERLAAGLAVIARESDQIGDARGLGMLHAIELVTNKSTMAAPDPQGSLARRVNAAAKQNGLLLYQTTGGVNDALLIAPPLTITAAEVDVLLEKLAASV